MERPQREAKTFCRLCGGHCGLSYSFDADGGIAKVQGDRTNPLTRGYACIKGLTLHEAHLSDRRLLWPLKRTPAGDFERIALEQAYDEIGERLRAIIAARGPDAVGCFRGTQSYLNPLAYALQPALLAAIGSHSFYSTMTIDQSAKWVTARRIGMWGAGLDPYELSDVFLLVGANPLVSLATANMAVQNPVKSIKEAKAAGKTLIVIDPRRSQTAEFADLHVQPIPGEDATLLAGLLRHILASGWEDRDFARQYVDGLESLRAAVEPFTPDYVAERTGVPAEMLETAARLFAEPYPDRRKRGFVTSGTGPSMGRHSNLSEHLIEAINIVCGRLAQPGDPVINPGVAMPRRPRRAEVVPPFREWESGWQDADGYGTLFGERMTATLPFSIGRDTPDGIHALIVDGGNPVNAIPESAKVSAAFDRLDLLVCIEPFLNETSRKADYILPPKMMLERAEITSPFLEVIFRAPYAQYAEAILPEPEGAELVDDWEVFWEIARRLDAPLALNGTPLDMARKPATDELIALLLEGAQVDFAAIRAAEGGRIFDVSPLHVEPGDGDAKFDLAPPDIVEELRELRAESAAGAFDLRLAVRRMRDVMNTAHHHLPTLEKRLTDNPLWAHPDDLASRGIAPGDRVRIVSANGAIEARAEADATLRAGVVSITHGWGGGAGVNVNALTSLGARDPINAMPVMTGYGVRLEPLVIDFDIGHQVRRVEC
ncbi:molybdopterin-dependent oxidoreductase [Sphingopyxis sp.]|uniref:molybdopterin-containing oxidoreductase family protein n=1 Tax=Sphingopyxis sp. TaxID=1908224 RepID=UPI0026347495|nr:molybdopterin-dependent oxidoreductase [Sphingopyxis sp.]MCW0200096.1 molybdopterin-dependent oxidoreductase [Sphingopyxis sp.]